MNLKQRFNSNRWFYTELIVSLVFLEVFLAEAVTRCGTPNAPASVVCDNVYLMVFAVVPFTAYAVARFVDYFRDSPVRPPETG